MAFGDSDLDVYLSDFGVPVVYGSTNLRGISRIYDNGNPGPEADNSTLGRWWEVLVKTGAMPGLQQDTPVTVDGQLCYVKSFNRTNDGAFTRLFCQAISGTAIAGIGATTPAGVSDNITGTYGLYKNVLIWGDSITHGLQAPNPYTQGFAGLTRAVVQKVFGNGNVGEGLVHVQNTDRWTFGGTWTAGTHGPWAVSKRSGAAGATASIVFTGTDVDIFYSKDSATGTFTVQIDAETPVTIGGSNGSLLYAKASVASSGGLGTHTVTLTSGAAALDVWGIAGRSGVGGVQVHNLGVGGAETATALQSNDYATLTGWIASIAPDLTVLAFGTNDYNNQRPVSSFTSNLTALITAVKASGDFGLIIPGPQNSTLTIPQTNYNSAQSSLVSSMGGKFAVDIYTRWGGTWAAATALGFESGDNVHPSGAGHADIAGALESLVLSPLPASRVAFFRYAAGDPMSPSFAFFRSASAPAYQFNSDGTITTVAASVARDAHYFGASRTLLIEPSSANRIYLSNDLRVPSGQWGSGGSGIAPTLGAGDPFGGSKLSYLNDTSATVEMFENGTIPVGVDGNQAMSFIVTRGSSHPGVATFEFRDSTAGYAIIGGVTVDWTAASPTVAATGSNPVSAWVRQIGSGAFYFVSVSFSAAVAAHSNQVWLVPGAYTSGSRVVSSVGDIYVAHVQLENGLVGTSPVVNAGTSGALTRDGDSLTYAVPFGSGQVGTLYEKYIDLATGALVEQASPYTTASNYSPQSGRAWLAWKFELGTLTLPQMQAL